MNTTTLFKSIKNITIPLNIFILIGLSYLIHYLNEQSKIKEGVVNSNCCGGIEAGVHYRETDRSPPEYVRRCFKSRRVNGQIQYDWDTMPCSSEDSDKCCTNVDGEDLGECVPSTGGGYCDNNNTKTMFRRGDSTASRYVRRSDDSLLDINNTIDMEDYFYERSAGRMERDLSPDMLDFLERRDQNNAYIQSHITDRNRDRIRRETQARLEAEEDKKFIQIKSSILAVHLLFVITFAILIKDLIVKDIDYYYDILNQRYLEFAGKTINKSVTA